LSILGVNYSILECTHASSISLFCLNKKQDCFTSNLPQIFGNFGKIKLGTICSFYNPMHESTFNHYMSVSSTGLNYLLHTLHASKHNMHWIFYYSTGLILQTSFKPFSLERETTKVKTNCREFSKKVLQIQKCEKVQKYRANPHHSFTHKVTLL
jgi:hypothetical protein